MVIPIFQLYRETPESPIRVAVYHWIDEPNASWWARTFGWPYKLKYVGWFPLNQPVDQ